MCMILHHGVLYYFVYSLENLIDFLMIFLVAPKNTTIRVSPSSIKEKMIFTVTCSAVANPQVSTYFISGPAGVVQSSTGVHNFTAQNCSSQSGTYSCTASNSLGNGTTESKQVDIYGESQPFL